MIITKGYKPEDKPRLVEINSACYSGIQRPSPAEFDQMLDHEVFVGSELAIRTDWGSPTIKNKVIGFAIVRENILGHPYLWSIAVDPAYQGRGVGGNLLREVIKFYTLAKAQEISLHVHPDNPAMKLYFDYGFRVRHVAKNWYQAEGDGLYMWRALP